ncbi:MAG: hypothetical protein AAFN00_05655 [Cyanobacteria bacterium J06558_2]
MPKFWKNYNNLPLDIQRNADKCYELLKTDSVRPLLHFKKISNKYWLVRIGLNYRALGVDVKSGISWFWIGNHKQYDKLIDKK